MESKLTDSRLEAFLDEALGDAEMAAIEQAARRDSAIASRLAELGRQRDAGQHSLAAIWRRQRRSPTRSRLGSYLLNISPADEATCVRLHVEVVGCPFCRANLDDLRREHAEQEHERQQRRRSIFDSSAGLLSRKPGS